MFAVFDVLFIRFPRFAIRRIREHKIKFFAGKFIGCQCRTQTDIFGVVPFNHHIRFADGIGFVVDFFTKQINIAGCFDFTFRVFNIILRFGKHPTGSTSRIVYSYYRRDLTFNGFENQMCHQIDYFTRGKMFAGFFVVFFIKTADELFKYIAHSQVGQWR